MGTFRYQSQTLFSSPEESLEEKNDYFASIMVALTTHGELLTVALQRLTRQATNLSELAQLLVQTLRGGRKVLVAGNGGSAAEAQHFAAELVGRFRHDRAPYAVMALTADTAILTAVANDYGYGEVFARQVQAFGQPGDLLIVFSTSGESENVLRAATAAKERNMTVTAILSERVCRLARLADLAIQVPVVDTATTQELHMVVTHLLCEIVETRLASVEMESRL
jgi:D-sedoheptulose 7-phosphate isomerase